MNTTDVVVAQGGIALPRSGKVPDAVAVNARWLVDDPAVPQWRRVRFVLVRHGESTWNAEGRIQGQQCSGLSALGHVQAHDAAAHLARVHPEPDVVAASDLPRVRQTAQPYLAAVGATGTEDPRLREIDNGVWSGRTTADVVADHPDEIAAIRRGEDIPRGGGETFAQMRARVDAALADLARRAVDVVAEHETMTAVVFTHGGPIRVGVAAALGFPAGGHRLLDTPDNASITELLVTVDADGARRASSLVAFSRLPLADSAAGRRESASNSASGSARESARESANGSDRAAAGSDDVAQEVSPT